MMRRSIVLRTSLFLLLAASAAKVARADEMVEGQHQVVIAGHPLASQIGLDVLHKGGNAADAYIAVSLALGAAEPGNSGMGGKVVMLYYDAKTKKTTCVVGMDAAPLKVDVAAIKADKTQTRGWTMTCVPGLVAGLEEIQKRWATRPWAELVKPAADLAENGFELEGNAADMLSEFPVGVDATASAVFAPGGKTLPTGAVLKNLELASTLRGLAANGPRWFYEGEPAEKIVAASQKNGGYLSKADFTQYHARVLAPLAGKYDGYDVMSSPPPLSGGTTLLASLECLSKMPTKGIEPRGVAYIDLLSRVLQQVYPEVSAIAADTPTARESVDTLLTPGKIDALVQRAAHGEPRAMGSDALGDRHMNELAFSNATLDDSDQASTTHLIIVDKEGDIVCCTQSLGLHFGAGVMAPGTGILLNADIGNFSLTATSPNMLAPGKWPRSTMAPTLFLKNDKPVLAIGSPAGQRIPTAVLQVALDVLAFHRDLKEAIRAPRFHLRTKPTKADPDNVVDIEAATDGTIEKGLVAQGWDVRRRMAHDFYFGSVNAAMIADGRVVGVADQRRTSDAKGD